MPLSPLLTPEDKNVQVIMLVYAAVILSSKAISVINTRETMIMERTE
jgi:hypothetical protein